MIEFKVEEENLVVDVKVKGMNMTNVAELLDTIKNVTEKEINQQKADINKLKEKKLTEAYSSFVSPEKGFHNPKSEYEKNGDTPSHSKSKEYGIKEYDGELKYQLFYICPSCGNKGKRYVPRGTIYTSCHECGNRMNTKAATDKGVGYTAEYQDDYSNFFIAGSFEREIKNRKLIAN